MKHELNHTLADPQNGPKDGVHLIGVAKDSIYRRIESDGLPAHKLGRLWKFKLSAVDDWVQGRSVDSQHINVSDQRCARSSRGTIDPTMSLRKTTTRAIAVHEEPRVRPAQSPGMPSPITKASAIAIGRPTPY